MKKAEVHNICTERESENYNLEEAYMQQEQVTPREGEVEAEVEKMEARNGCIEAVNDTKER